jgi:SPP1 gp7 family putative phage head morphogenesis protein
MAVALAEHKCNHGLVALEGRRDPTRTLTIRNAFARDMAKRFRELRGAIRRAIVEEDVFGLSSRLTAFQLSTPGRRAFAFSRSSDKVEAFSRWLQRQENTGILQTIGPQLGAAAEQPWTNKYIQTVYQRGILRSRQEMIKTGFDVPAISEATGGIQVAFNNPFHMDRVGLLFTRTFSDLKGITNAMDTQISRVLSQAMAEGRNPNEIARLLTRTISGPVGDLGLTDTLGRFIPAERRAQLLARTEIIRAHHGAMIQEYRNWEVAGVVVKAEWVTAQDGRVCPICEALEERTFTLDEAEALLPRHPQCRCITIPVEESRL